MGDHFQDTVFGQIVRLISGKRFLKFPDELDPNLWKPYVQEESTAASSTSGEQNDLVRPDDHAADSVSEDRENLKELGTGISSEQALKDKQALHQETTSHEKTKGVILVDWYGPDDREV